MASMQAAGGGRRGRRRGKRAGPMNEINMTPFIDVMLVLLIIFMVAAPLMTVGVPLDLPKTAASPLNSDTKPVTLSIRQGGQIFLGEDELTNEAIVGRLSSASKQGERELSLSLPPPTPSPDSTLTSTLSNSFLFRNMRVVTKERTAREKLEITFDMRFTLREMVQSAAAFLHSRDGVNGGRVDSMEFTMTEKRSTTHLPTAEHPSSNFEFKAYAGSIFSRLRWFYGVTDDNYLQSVAGSAGYTDFIANSKSGSFFFYTYDKAYMIKSMTRDESEFLRVHVLPSYYHHLTVYRDSLLSKIFGLYRIRKRSMSHPVYFMVMRNVFYTQKPIHMVTPHASSNTHPWQTDGLASCSDAPLLRLTALVAACVCSYSAST